MRALALVLLLPVLEARAERVCLASCRATNTSCQQKCGEGDDSLRADCRASCVRSFFDCRCGCGDVSYCEVESEPQPGCKLVARADAQAQREASAPSGRRPASNSTRTSSAPAGKARPKSRR